MKSSNSRKFRPTLELLEDRLTPSATVTTSLAFGNLTITDHAAANSIAISQPAANEITITPDAGTSINGQAAGKAVTINNVRGNVTINLGAGNNTLTFDLSGGGITINRSLSITGGNGNMTVATTTAGTSNFLNVGGSLSDVFGNGNESVTFLQFHVAGSMTVSHGNGDSFVTLGVDHANLGQVFDSVGGNLNVLNQTRFGNLASGNNVNALEETNVGGSVYVDMGLGVNGGSSTIGAPWTSFGTESASGHLTVGGNLTIIDRTDTLSGGDFFNDGEEVAHTSVGGAVSLNLGSGAGNIANFGGSSTSAPSTAPATAGALFISGSGAGDGVFVTSASIFSALSVALSGSGANTVALDALSVGGDSAISTAAGNDTIQIDNTLGGSTFHGDVNISTGSGNDTLSINGGSATKTTTFDDEVSANLGAGDDTLMVATAGKVDFLDDATFDGGTGTNHATVTTANIQGNQPTLRNFS